MYVFILLFNHLKQQKINNNDSVPLNVPLSHDSEPSYTIDDLWNAAKCDFPAVACQNVCMKPPSESTSCPYSKLLNNNNNNRLFIKHQNAQLILNLARTVIRIVCF